MLFKSLFKVVVFWAMFNANHVFATNLFFDTSYTNLFLAGTDQHAQDFALVAGSHNEDFPYENALAWDNGLLWLNGEAYHFTQRQQGVMLHLDLNVQSEGRREGIISYHGTVIRHSDNLPVYLDMSLLVSTQTYGLVKLGSPSSFFNSPFSLSDYIDLPGMRWRPSEIEQGYGTVSINDGSTSNNDPTLQVSAIHGEVEHGDYIGVRSDSLSVSYDYVGLARANSSSTISDGYAYVNFIGHALYPDGWIGRALDWYLGKVGSAEYTLRDGQRVKGNTQGIYRPPSTDSGVVLFENEVDLGIANLRRQMIRVVDPQGNNTYGLREIFEAR